MAEDGPLGLGLNYPRLLLYVLVSVVVVGMVVAAGSSATSFGAYNARWDGASELRETATHAGSEATIVRNVSQYGESSTRKSVSLVLSPDRPYTESERTRLRQFVRNGGTLVVAEDFGPNGNTLLDAVGATARFDGTLLRDERHNYRAPTLPIATDVSNHSLTEDVDRLTLNRGTVIEPGSASVLVRSSEFSYLDSDGAGTISENESLSKRPVATVENVSNGRVVAVSDPSLFINTMLDQPDNRQFVRNLFGSGESVLLDYSHTAEIPPLALALIVVRDAAWLQAGLGAAMLAVVAVWSRGLAGRAIQASRHLRHRESRGEAEARTEDLVAYVKRQHPDWDEERVRRIVATIHGGSKDE